MPEVRKLSILIPVFNEVRTLSTLLDRVHRVSLPVDKEIVIVDDCSMDGTREFLQDYAQANRDVKLILHDRNLGKGAAVRSAIREMTGDWAIVQDADLEYDPADYAVLLEPAMKGIADAVFGSRFLTGRYRRAMYFWHTFINKAFTAFSNVANGINLTDIYTCYKLVRADILKSLVIRSNGFDFEPEITAKLARWGARIYEVPISYSGRTYEEGKKIGLKDALTAVVAIIRFRFFDSAYCADPGFSVLQAMRRARRFNRWLFNRFSDHVGRAVLEAGCGIGNITRHLLDCRRLVCVDVNPLYIERMRSLYGHLQNVRFECADLTNDHDMDSLGEPGCFDTVIHLNVLEHIEDDLSVLRRFHRLLAPGGKLVVLVPNCPGLYGATDRALGHVRRYTREEIAQKLLKTGFTVLKITGFNRAGGLGWRVSSRLLRRSRISCLQLALFDALMPLVRLMEYVPIHPHNSLIAIAQKPGA